MKTVLQRAWRQLILMGVLSIIFGILSFIWPEITLRTLIYLFAFTIIAQGISIIIGAWNSRDEGNHWMLFLLLGIVDILAGLIAIFYPDITALFLIILIGVQAFFSGVLEIVAAIRLRNEIENEGWLILTGLLSVVFGLWVIFLPGAGALAMIWLIASFSIAFGIMLIMLAMKARNWINHSREAIRT